MEILPVDITSLVAVLLGISVVLIPVIGLTARFALKPTVEALSRLFEGRAKDEQIRILERRLELQEQEMAMLSQAVRSLSEAHDFDRALGAPKPTGGRATPDTLDGPGGTRGPAEGPPGDP